MPRLATTLTALAAAAVLALSAGAPIIPAQAATTTASAKARPTLKATPRVVSVGSTIYLTGRAGSKARKVVKLQQRKKRGSAWKRVTSGRTMAGGQFQFTPFAMTRGSLDYRVCQRGKCSRKVRVRVTSGGNLIGNAPQSRAGATH